MFSRFFSFSQSTTGKNNNNNKSSSHSFSVDKIRVIVFQDTGDKLKLPLFDTKSPYKSSHHTKTYSSSSSLSSSEKHSYSKPGSFSLIYKTPRRYSHYSNDKHSQSWTSNEENSPIYKKRSNHNFELLGEIMFGTAPIAYKGVITKVHLLKIPQPQIVWTKLFSISAFDEEVSLIKNDSILNKSSSEYSMSYGSLRYFQQKDFEFNQQPLIAKNLYNMDTQNQHHGLFASNNNLSSQASSPSNSFNSGKSSSTINLSSQRRSKRFTTSLTMENLKSATSSNTDKSIDSISSEADLQNNTQVLRRSRRRRILYAIGVIIDTEVEPVFREFFFTHFILLENHIQILYETLVDTICSIYRKNQTKSTDSNKFGQEEYEESQMQMLPPYAIQKNPEFLAAVEKFQNSICELYCSPRIQKPLWLTMMTFPGEKKSCCNILISEFCKLINKMDIKKTGFFLSKVLTSVLAYHISWVTTVASSMYIEFKDKNKRSKQLNPYLEQLSSLYGNLGTKKISRTIITGNQDKAQIQKLLYILTYFIRCSELHEHIEYIQNLNRQESYCSSIRSDSLLSTFSNSATSLNQQDQLDSKFKMYGEPDTNGYKNNRMSTLSMNVNINANSVPLEDTTLTNNDNNDNNNKDNIDKSINNIDQDGSDTTPQNNIGITTMDYQNNTNTVKHSMLTEKLILSSDVNLSKLAENEAKKNLTKELVSVPLPKTLITRTVPDCFADEYLRYNPVTLNSIPQQGSESVNIPINSNQSKSAHGMSSLNDNSNSFSQNYDSSYTNKMKPLSSNDIHLSSSITQEFQTNNNLQQYIPKLTPKNSQINPSPMSSPINSFSPSFSQVSSSPSLSISPMSIYDNKSHNSILSSSPSISQLTSKSSNYIPPNDQLQYRSFGRSLLADYCSNGYQSDFALMGCSRCNIERIKRDLEASIRYSYFSKPINHSTCIIADVDNYQCHIIECIVDDSVEVDNETGIDNLENEELRKYHLDNNDNGNNKTSSVKSSNQKNSLQNNIPSIEINSKSMKNNGGRNSNHRISGTNNNGRYFGAFRNNHSNSNGNSFDDSKGSHENSSSTINLNNSNTSGIPINIKNSRSSLNIRRNHDYHSPYSPYGSNSLSYSYNRHHQAQVFIPTITSSSNSSTDLSPLKFRIDHPQASNFIIKMLTELKDLYNNGLPPETCTMYIEDQLKDLCYESILVASFLKDKKEILYSDLIKICTEIGLDPSDISLITAILSISDERYLRIKNTNISQDSSFSNSSKRSGNSNSYKDYSSSSASSISSSLLNQRFSTRLKQRFSQH